VACVDASEAGYYASELENVLNVGVKDALRKLVNDDRLARVTLGGRYLYCSASLPRQKQQAAARQVHEAEPSALGFGGEIHEKSRGTYGSPRVHQPSRSTTTSPRTRFAGSVSGGATGSSSEATREASARPCS